MSHEIRTNEDGTLDEVVADNPVHFHLEQMGDDCWWMRVYMPEGEKDIVIFLSTRHGAHIHAVCEEE